MDPVFDPTRLQKLRETGLLDSAPDDAFDRFARLAAHLLAAPTALVSLVDDTRQFFKAAVGLAEPVASRRGTPLSHSFCQHAVRSGEALIVGDARRHPLLKDNPAISELAAIAYAGIPLVVEEWRLGVLCVLDHKPREWTVEQVSVLADLAMAVSAEIELRVAARRLRQSEALYRAIADHLPNATVMTFDHELRVVSVDGSQALARTSHLTGPLVGRPIRDLVRADNADEVVEAYQKAIAGETTVIEAHDSVDDRVYEIHAAPVLTADGTTALGLAMAYDVTERAKLRRQLTDLSTHDELTGLLNRRGFIILVSQQLKIAKRAGRTPVLFFIDLNGMKQINDTQGHEAGDRALQDTANVLRTSFREADILARLGGDEFVVLAIEASQAIGDALHERLGKEVAALNAAEGRPFRLSLSVGRTQFDPKAPKTVDELLAEADAKMYETKRARQARGQSLPVKGS